MEKTIYSREYNIFLKELRQKREELGITQEELAERLGVTQSFISKCERGERRIDIIELRYFCMGMRIPFPEFVLYLDQHFK